MKKVDAFFAWLGALVITFGDDVKKFIEEYASPAITFLNAVKAAINNPTVDIIANAVSNGAAQAIIDELSAGLVTVIGLLQTDANEITGGETVTAANSGTVLAAYLAKQPAAVQNALLAKTASLLANKLAAKNNITIAEKDADTYTQLAYDKTVKEAAAPASETETAAS